MRQHCICVSIPCDHEKIVNMLLVSKDRKCEACGLDNDDRETCVHDLTECLCQPAAGSFNTAFVTKLRISLPPCFCSTRV